MEGWIYGVDVGLSRVTVGLLSDSEAKFVTRRTDGLYDDLPRKLIELEDKANEVADSLMHDCPPAVVAVEMPFGRFRSTEFGAAFGATILGINLALNNLRHPPPIWTVTVSEWKAATVGKGNASKPAVMQWAKANLLSEIPTQDVADALSIAAFARAKLTWASP